MKLEQYEDVVISGVGGYFPKSHNLEELKTHLFNNEILLENRWKAGERGVCNKIGKVPSIEFFDTAFFGIHRQQCTFMDPMQRLVLERTFEALLDAGVNPIDIRGKRVGVFFGSSIGENDNLFYESIVSGFGVTGHSRAMMPNRVSYWLNLKGPSCAYDSNWVNGVEVLRLAFQSVREGHCESAIIGTANLALNSELSWLYNEMGLISPDGSTKSFDVDANGYARSDGVVVLYIQRASEAKRSYASVVNVAARFNGNREGTLLDLSVDDMVDFMSTFYSECGVDPHDVDFVETYGSAQKKIDKAEIDALEKVYCKNRKNPLLIGSIKPNTGHSEASAALFSLVKVLIAMDSNEIPATIQYEKPNPEIKALVDGTVQVLTENKKWKGGYAAVNAIGLDSYYGHVLLKSNPKNKEGKKDDLPRLAIASTRTEEGIKEILNTINSKPTIDPEYVALIQDVYKKPINGHLYRGYTVLDEEIKQEFEYFAGNKRQIWFVYSGMGSQWCGMANHLMKLPIFASAINKCHQILVPKGLDLLKIITNDDPTTFDNILHSFVGIAAVQIGLTDVLNALGIVPDGIIGHSVGELGCAYADGCLTAEQMILSAYSRGRASQEVELIKGMMAAVGLGYQQIKDKCPPTIEVACHNGPDSSTISGPTKDMEEFVKNLQGKGIFARLVNVANIAYHSRYIKPAAPYLLKYLQEVIPKPVARSQKWISTSVPESQWENDLAKTSSAEYHTNNLLSSVLFEEGLKHIPKDSILIEIAPHGLLQAILKRSLKTGCTNVALTHRGSKNGLNFLLSSLGKLYLAGIDLNLPAIFPPVSYPVSRGTPGLANLAHWEHGELWHTGLEDKQNYLVTVKDIQVTLNSEDFRDNIGHQLGNRIIVPTSSYLLIILKMLSVSISKEITNIVFENLFIRKVLNIPKIGSVPLYAMIQKGSGEFEILSGDDIIITGKVTIPIANEQFLKTVSKLEVTKDSLYLPEDDVYNEFQHRGHKYSGFFRSIKNLTMTEDGSIGAIQWDNKWPTFLEAMLQQFLLTAGERNQNILIPTYIRKIAFSIPLLPTEKTELDVVYNYSTGIISAEGIQIMGVKVKPPPLERTPISYDSVEYIGLNNDIYKKIENVLNICLHMVMDNFENRFSNNIAITEVETENPLLIENIKNTVNEYTELNANVVSVKDPKLVIIPQDDPFFVVMNSTLRDDIAKVISSSHGFILVQSSKNILSYPQLVQVGSFIVNGVSYSLLRKTSKVKPNIVHVQSDSLSVDDMSTNEAWVVKFKNALKNIKSRDERVYLVTSTTPCEGVRNFVEAVLFKTQSPSFRFVFLPKKDVVQFTADNVEYQNVFKQDLVLNILKDSNCIPIPLTFKENISQNLHSRSNVIGNTTIKYIGVNLHDETLLPENKQPNADLGNIDYSGVTESGKNVMGLGKIDKDSYHLVLDPILNWELPKNWSLEDGATVTHAYCGAYYALVQKAKLKPGETVLIHAGCKPVSLAAISIASAMGCIVYTTVATDEQKAYLKKKFDFLKDRNILSSEYTTFEPYFLMATGGIGAHVILNTLSGSLLQATTRCVADFGRFIQIGKFDRDENNSIGMSLFLRNITFYGVNLENMLEMTVESKTELHELFCKGMEAMVVRPLRRMIVEHQQVSDILSLLRKNSNIGNILIKVSNQLMLNQFNTNNTTQFICEAKSSYLVFGGSAEAWADMIEWLILRGARKIVVSSESRPQNICINRRLSLLQTYFNADIIFAPSKVQSSDSASELLSEVYYLGPIHGIFLLPNKNAESKTNIEQTRFLDMALRKIAPKALFVNFVKEAAGICHSRGEVGYFTHSVQWSNSLDLTDAFYGLDEILNYKVRHFVIKNDKISDVEQETTQSLFKKMMLLLPSTPDELKAQIKYNPAVCELVQIPSLGPRVIRELPPLFIVPGVSRQNVAKELARQLLHPTFCTVLPSSSVSLEKLAADFAEKMKCVYPSGPYNIIGISWGGALAIEIAKYLEKSNRKIQLYFIDGSPDTIQAAIKHLGEGVNAETNLLTRIFNVNNNETIKSFNSLPNWNARVKLILDQHDCCEEDKNLLSKALTLVKERLELVSAYKPTQELIAGPIHLLRPTGSSKYDNCGLTKYCKQSVEIHLIQGDHLSIVKNRNCTDIINENATTEA